MPNEVNFEERMIELNTELGKELEEWTKLGVPDPNAAISFNAMQIQAWIKALTKFLAEKGIIDEPEFIIFFKEYMLEHLKKARTEQIEPAVLNARMEAIDLMPAMDVPRGKPKFQ